MNNTELWCIDCGEGSGYVGKNSDTNGNRFDDVEKVERFLAKHETQSFPTAVVHRLLFVRTSDIEASTLPVDMAPEIRRKMDA